MGSLQVSWALPGGLRSPLPRIAEGIDHEAGHGDADAGIGDVKGRPGIGEADMEIEEEKIDHVSVEESIGEIAQNPGQEQAKRDASPRIARSRTREQENHDDERDTGNKDEKAVVVPERTEGRPGVGHMNETEDVGRDQVARLGGIDETEDEIFRDLIERVERDGEKEENSHAR